MAKRPGCPCFLCGFLFVGDVLHEIAGLTVQGSANLVQDVNGQMLCRSGTDGGKFPLHDGSAEEMFLIFQHGVLKNPVS